MSSSPYEDPRTSAAGEPASKFGTQPYAPGAAGGPISEPKKFGLLKNLTIASFLLFAVGTIAGSVTFGSEGAADWIRELYSDPQFGMSDEEIEAIVDGMAVMGVGFAVIAVVLALALYLIVYIGLVKKKDWARVTGIVFGIIGLVLTVVSLPMNLMMDFYLGSAAGITSLIFFVLYAAVSIYWLVLAFNSEIRQYLGQFKK